MKKYIIKLSKCLHLYKVLRTMLIAIKHIVKYRKDIQNRFMCRLLIRPFKKGISLPHEWYGEPESSYGSCVYSDMLNEHSIVYSFGIGSNVSFDTDIIDRHNCRVFGFDLNPRSIAWVERNTMPENFLFHGYGIAAQTGTVALYLPKRQEEFYLNIISTVKYDNVSDDYVAHLPVKSLADIMAALSHDHIDVLKMDIEGAEFEVMEAILHSPICSSIGQMVIEFHEMFLAASGRTGRNMNIRDILSYSKLQKTRRIVTLLKERGFEIFAQDGSTISFINTRRLNQ